MKSPARLVWLIDVDGTLLTTEGGSRLVFARAANRILGGADHLDGIEFAGRTDPLILKEILATRGATFDLHDEASFWDAVFDGMRDGLVGRGHLMPGVPQLLDAIDREPGWIAALLTGNMTQMAEVKLRHFGIWERFAYGAFGEEAADRNALARIAAARALEYYGVPHERCIVIGDTERDIECARAANAVAVAVATGVRPRDFLAAHHPDLLLDSLADTAALVAWGKGIAGGAQVR
jgi:phosphoglycolate phosphatase-like HAD superfamily hydrolase